MDKDNITRSFANGFISGTVGILISHPFDTIKTCIQDNKPVNFGYSDHYIKDLYHLYLALVSKKLLSLEFILMHIII